MNDNPFKMPTISISLEGFSAGLFSSQRVFFHQTGDNIVLAITKISEAAFEALNEWATAEQLQTEKDVIDHSIENTQKNLINGGVYGQTLMANNILDELNKNKK